jgi:hypothetical protein
MPSSGGYLNHRHIPVPPVLHEGCRRQHEIHRR